MGCFSTKHGVLPSRSHRRALDAPQRRNDERESIGLARRPQKASLVHRSEALVTDTLRRGRVFFSVLEAGRRATFTSISTPTVPPAGAGGD